MRRWAPAGLQRLVEAMQSTFIQHSDGKIGAEQLREYLLQRRDQLLRAAEATGRFNAALAEVARKGPQTDAPSTEPESTRENLNEIPRAHADNVQGGEVTPLGLAQIIAQGEDLHRLMQMFHSGRPVMPFDFDPAIIRRLIDAIKRLAAPAPARREEP